MSNPAYHKQYNAERYKRVRAEAIAILGGKCVCCGETDKLQLDHKDHTQKSFELSKLWSTAREKFLVELAKCQLLCETCHKAKTRQDLGQQDARLTHGTLSSYRYCKCDLCRAAKSAYSKEYNKRQLSTDGSAPDL